jgi:hypothetical protein
VGALLGGVLCLLLPALDPTPVQGAPAPATAPAKKKSSYRYTQFIAVRGVVGGGDMDGTFVYTVGVEATLLTLHWRYFTWEMLRAGYNNPLSWNVGTAFGFPVRWGPRKRHEIRFGFHLTTNVRGLQTPFVASGLQIVYQLRLYRRLRLQVGLLQTSIPTGLLLHVGLAL